MEQTTDTTAAAPDTATVSAPESSPGVDYGKVSDDDILNSGSDEGSDEGVATGEAPADDASAKSAPAEAKDVKTAQDEQQPKPEDTENPVNEVIEPEELKALFKQHPALRSAWYREAAYREVFPTIAEARAVKEYFPTADLAKQASDNQAMLFDIDKMYVENPAMFASKFIQGNPAAFRSFMEEMRPVLHQMSPTAYKEIVAEPVFRDTLNNLKGLAAKRDDQELAQVIEILEERMGFQSQDKNRELVNNDPRIRAAEMSREQRQREVEQRYEGFAEDVNRTYWDGLRKTVSDAIGKPEAMSDKAIEMVTTEVMDAVSEALAARQDLKRIFDVRTRQGDFSPQHKEAVAEFVLKYARQIVPVKARERLTAWTNDILRVNKKDIETKAAAPIKKDIGSGSGHVPKAKTQKINYRTMSDDDILNS